MREYLTHRHTHTHTNKQIHTRAVESAHGSLSDRNIEPQSVKMCVRTCTHAGTHTHVRANVHTNAHTHKHTHLTADTHSLFN